MEVNQSLRMLTTDANNGITKVGAYWDLQLRLCINGGFNRMDAFNEMPCYFPGQ